MSIRTMGSLAIFVAGLAIVFLPTGEARAAHESGLLKQVNAAIREAGASVTVERSLAFQKGVVNGHYTSYSQLVGAIIFHKNAEALPKFTAGAHTTSTKETITGDVLSLSNESITVRGDDDNGNIREVFMSIASNQYDFALSKGVMAGSNVTVCSVDGFLSQYGHIVRNDS